MDTMINELNNCMLDKAKNKQASLAMEESSDAKV